MSQVHNEILTSKDMPKLPFNIMKVPSNKLLRRRRLSEILQTNRM